jgi:predicted signal transduction protein with EAL and GGDEF domain
VLRGTDTLARLGGDEFGILFSDLEGEKEAAIFDRVISSLALPIPLGKEFATVGGSLGITIIPPDEGGDESLIKHADLAMYMVKEHGKNGWEVFQPMMSRSLENAHRVKEELTKAFQEKRFSIHYQPQVEMTSGKIEGLEALLRWDHPDRGQLKSEEFIGILEGCDLVVDLGRWVLEEILSHIPLWAEHNLHPRVRMNVGSRHLLSGTFIEDLRSAFSRHPDIPPQSLELDISETRSFQEIRKVKAIFNECRRFGVAITISHVGTDHGSLSYIQTLGIDRVSIDQQFPKTEIDF